MSKRNIIISIILIVTLLLTIIIVGSAYAYYTAQDGTINKFKVGSIEVTVTEPNYTDNAVVKPNEEIVKDPTFSNTGKVNSYIRAQVYMPISSSIKYVDNSENIITPTGDIPLFSYTINTGWQLVNEDGFSGTYTDEDGNKYAVYTYKYMQDGNEKIISPDETISVPVFSKVKAINYLDTDKEQNFKIYVNAIAVQSDGGTANEMWTRYLNQKGTGIVRNS